MVGALSHWDEGREEPQRALELRQYSGICGVPAGGVGRGGVFSPACAKT